MEPNPVQIAQYFAQTLEDDPAARKEYLIANLHNFRWIKSPPYQSEPVNFWTYGPDIPKTDGILLPVCNVWYAKPDGWTYCFSSQATKYTKCDTFEEIKILVEEKATEQWGGADAKTR